MPPPRFVSGIAILALAAGAVGCSSTPGPSGSGSPAASVVLANLPDLGLKHVAAETAAARGATIGPNGGSISATGSNGATYTLSIPAGALEGDAVIGLYPVAKVDDLPGATSLTAGAQFSPDGLRLIVPATFTIQLPTGIDGGRLSGITWSGDGADARRYPVVADGQTVTISLRHFSGAGAGNGADMPNGSADCPDIASMDALLDADHTANRTDRAAYARDLKTCYRQFVLPAMQDSEAYAEAHDLGFNPDAGNLDPAREYPGVDAYAAWRLDIEVVDAWLGGSGFDVSPELHDSLLPASHLLRAWYDATNDQCIAAADADMDSTRAGGAIYLANAALTEHYNPAAAWGIATVASKLDLETLLNDLCVRVVIDPKRDFSGSKPGDSGTITVPIGYTIAGGPVRHDRELTVEWGLTGSPDVTLGFSADLVTHDFTWPDGVDPLQIDVRAEMPYPYTAIARFDRITKSAKPGRIAFVSDRNGANPEIWVMNEDGTNAVQLTHGVPGRPSSMPAWSPDGTRIAFSSNRDVNTYNVWVMDADGSNQVRLTQGDAEAVSQWPTWSPDGTRIAFLRQDADFRATRIAVMDATGANVSILTTPEKGSDSTPAWSPNGDVIAFSGFRTGHSQIYLVDVATKAVTLLTPDTGTTDSRAPAWSPDGTRIAFVHFDGHYSIQVMNADGTGVTTAYDDLPGETYPTWSRDGTRLAFTMPAPATGAGEAKIVAAIFVINTDGTGLLRLSPTDSSNVEPDWLH